MVTWPVKGKSQSLAAAGETHSLARESIPPYGELLITVIPAPERESLGGDSRLESMSGLPELVPHEELCKGLHTRARSGVKQTVLL